MSLEKKIRHVSKRTLERGRDPQEEKEGQERVMREIWSKITTYIHVNIIINTLFSIIYTNKIMT